MNIFVRLSTVLDNDTMDHTRYFQGHIYCFNVNKLGNNYFAICLVIPRCLEISLEILSVVPIGTMALAEIFFGAC